MPAFSLRAKQKTTVRIRIILSFILAGCKTPEIEKSETFSFLNL